MPLATHGAQIRKYVLLVNPHPRPFSQWEKGKIPKHERKNSGSHTLRRFPGWREGRSFLSQYQRRDQSDDEPDGKRLDKTNRRIHKRVVDQVGFGVIDEIRHQLEIHDFPGHDIADTNDEGDERANCESAAEGYFAT